MKREIITVESEYENLVIHATVTIPDGNPVGVVHIYPGLTESRSMYNDLSIVLASYQYVTLCADYRGHGDSVDDKHPLGHMSDEDGWMKNLKDMNIFCQWIREKYRHLPYYIFSSGMGTLIARSFLKRFEYEVSGIIMADCPNVLLDSRIIKKASAAFEGFGKPFSENKTFTRLLTRGVSQNFAGSDVENAWYSADPEVCRKYNEDPSCGFHFSKRMTRDLMFGVEDACVFKDWHVLKSELPILLLNGEDSAWTGGEDGISRTGDFLRMRGYHSIEKIDYPGRRSNLVDGKGNEEVLQDILIWYNKVTRRLKEE